MANYLTTDTDLTAVANAIRTKGGTSAQLEWPEEYISAILAIPSGSKTLTSITAVFTQGSTVVYETDTLASLKPMLVVTANYSDMTTETVPSADYTLSGTLTVGTSIVTVTYNEVTTTFTVAVSAAPIDLLNVTWANHAITCGQDTNNYNAWSPHNLQYDSVNDCFVFLQCHCNQHLNSTYTNWTLSIVNPYDSTDYTDITIPTLNGLGMLYVENGVWTLMPRNQSYAYRSSDMGETWETLQANIPQYLFGVYKCGDTYFGGDDKNSGLKYHVSSDLLNWTEKSFDSSLGYTTLCETTFCEFDGKYWAFNRTNDSTLGHPVILQSNDQGATWTLFSDQDLHGYRSTVSCLPFQNYIMVADIDRDNGILYYNKFDGEDFTQLNTWQMPNGGDDFHNVNIVSNYKDTVVLEFMHTVPHFQTGSTIYSSDKWCDNVMIVGSTKALPSLTIGNYIDTAADMLTYANANLTSGLNSNNTYTWQHPSGSSLRIQGSNSITTFVDEIELPLNMIQVAFSSYRVACEMKNGANFATPINNPDGGTGTANIGTTNMYALLGFVTINNVLYGYGVNGKTNEFPVLVRQSGMITLTQNTPGTNENYVTGETWQEALGFRRVISVNKAKNNSYISPVPNGLWNTASEHKIGFMTYTPVASGS